MDEPAARGDAFAAGEGDRYFERNQQALVAYDVDTDPVARCVQLAGLRPASLLEVGAASGERVAALAGRLGAKGMAIDPSVAAVEDGRRRHTGVDFAVASMDALPAIGPFDLVIVNFVLHWVERDRLLRSVAELDRMVVDGGHLLIGDFLPAGHVKTPYHHRPGLWTFKQDYPSLFATSGLYSPVVTMVGEHGGTVPSGVAQPSYRMQVSVLQKSLQEHYLTVLLDS